MIYDMTVDTPDCANMLSETEPQNIQPQNIECRSRVRGQLNMKFINIRVYSRTQLLHSAVPCSIFCGSISFSHSLTHSFAHS